MQTFPRGQWGWNAWSFRNAEERLKKSTLAFLVLCPLAPHAASLEFSSILPCVCNSLLFLQHRPSHWASQFYRLHAHRALVHDHQKVKPVFVNYSILSHSHTPLEASTGKSTDKIVSLYPWLIFPHSNMGITWVQVYQNSHRVSWNLFQRDMLWKIRTA